MLPADLSHKNFSPPFVILPEDSVILPAEMAHGALTPQKRATTEQHSNYPVAKRLQLINEACDDLSSGKLPNSLENNNCFNRFNNNNNNNNSDEKIETSGDSIAGTPAFITTLMKFIKFSDEQRQSSIDNSKLTLEKQQTPPPPTSSTTPSVSEKEQANWLQNLYEGYKTTKLPLIACETSLPSHISLPSMNQIIPNKPYVTSDMEDEDNIDDDDCVFDEDDDRLLSNLPTSVDDLQDMEKQIKMERHFSSPLMSHRHTPSYYEAGRLSAASGASFVIADGSLSVASIHPEEDQLDADDLEVAMINESFEEQQRQYKLYCGDKLKSAFYSAPEDFTSVEHDPSMVYPLTVPSENDEPLYTNDSLYGHWKEESPPLSSTYSTITKPSDIYHTLVPALDVDDSDADEDEMNSIDKSSIGISLHPSIPESMDSLKLYSITNNNNNNNNNSLRSDILSPDDSLLVEDVNNFGDDDDDDAIATVLSSANFVLDDEMDDSPELIDCDDEDEDISENISPLLMKSPSSDLTTPPPTIDDISHVEIDYEEDEAELVSAWNECKHSDFTGDSVRYYFPRKSPTPLPPPLLDKIEEPPKNIKTLAHVTEIYDPAGELDSEPALQYFQSIGMKNFYQREIDIQRAFLVFPSVADAKIAVENNKTGLQLRLLEESPQFVKSKAIKMYSELRPYGYDCPAEPHMTEKCHPWHSLSEPIAGV